MPLLPPLNPPIADWRGRVVWIVGGSSGIGLALAEALAARGAQVALSARDAAALQRAAEAHAAIQAWPMDATAEAGDPRSAAAVASALQARHGRIDDVIYCAGHYRPLRATAFDLAEMQRHLDVNLVGALRVLQAVLPLLLAQRSGHVGLVASVAGYRGLPQGLAYGPTKAALIHLAQTLYLDLRPQGIAVSLINPGFVRTPMTAVNRFRMPALIEPAQAARAILDGWARGRFEIHFPRRFTQWLRLMRWLPDRLYFAAVRRATGL